MRYRLSLLFILMSTMLLLFACNLAPPPPPTAVPTVTPSPEPSPTITPTLGPREFFNGVFCWQSPIDEGEYNLLRFFEDGTVLDATVAPFGSCGEAWQQMASLMTIDRAADFGHGEYFLSGELIRFELAAPNSSQIVGEATGTLEGNRMSLTKGGALQEYDRIE